MVGPYYIGVDVGTASARAALVTPHGELVASATQAISILEPASDFYEQSSQEIWNACCKCIQAVTQNIRAEDIHGLGFDATCSLVVLDKDFHPIAVSDTGDNRYNVIMWMDHRAKEQAKFINSKQHTVLRYTGGSISLEMQPPKLLWLKQKLDDETWKRMEHFFDLPDFLTWRATGSLSRSLCSLVCKWTYQADTNSRGWDKSFFEDIGLADLLENDCSKIGDDVQMPGSPCGSGLTEWAAKEMGLNSGTPVATSIVDAHAGGLGMMSCRPRIDNKTDEMCDHSSVASASMTTKLALICGTSTCHMAISNDPLFVPGVWGPYYSAMVPLYWLNEGGQSATGKLLDHIISTHPAQGWVKSTAENKLVKTIYTLRQVHVYTVLEEILDFVLQRDKITTLSSLTSQFHVLPDYHGNRSPLAEPSMTGMICGLRLSSGVEDLAIQYLATVQALAYGTRQILNALTVAGHKITHIYVCGGLAKNRLFVQTHADVTGLPLVLPDMEESVLLGSAVLGATASHDFDNIQDAMNSMSGCGTVIYPNKEDSLYHERKYCVFLRLSEDQKRYREHMSEESSSCSS